MHHSVCRECDSSATEIQRREFRGQPSRRVPHSTHIPTVNPAPKPRRAIPAREVNRGAITALGTPPGKMGWMG